MLRLVALAVCGLVVLSGWSLTGCSASRPDPVARVPFADFEVGRSGGVAGVQEVLHVRADGVALLVSGKPAAGRLSQPTLDRIRTLLESEGFRREVAANTADRQPPTCADLLSSSVRMGTLQMSVEDACGKQKRAETPAFDEILTLTADARQGQFAGPVDTEEPRLIGLRLDRTKTAGQAGYAMTVAASGEVTLMTQGQPLRRETLSTAEQDALRLLVARLVETPVTDCQSTVYYRLTISGFPASSGPDCGYRDRYAEFRAITAHLQTAVG